MRIHVLPISIHKPPFRLLLSTQTCYFLPYIFQALYPVDIFFCREVYDTMFLRAQFMNACLVCIWLSTGRLLNGAEIPDSVTTTDAVFDVINVTPGRNTWVPSFYWCSFMLQLNSPKVFSGYRLHSRSYRTDMANKHFFSLLVSVIYLWRVTKAWLPDDPYE